MKSGRHTLKLVGPGAAAAAPWSRTSSLFSRTGEYIYLYFIECGDWTDERGAPYTLGRGRGRGANPNVVSSRAERRGPGRVQGAAELLYAYSMPTLCHRETVVGVGGDARQET